MYIYVRGVGTTSDAPKELLEDIYNLAVIARSKEADIWKKMLIKHHLIKKTSKAQFDIHNRYIAEKKRVYACVSDGRGTTHFVVDANIDELVGAFA